MNRLALIVASLALCTTPAWAQLGEQRVQVGAEHCVVNVASDDVLNVRKGPAADTGIVAIHRYGECGIMLTAACEDGWCPVEDGHVAGWVNAKYIGVVEPPFFCVGLFHRDPLPLRAFPDETSRVIIDIPSDNCSIAALPYVKGAWLKVRVDGYEGWVPYEHLYAQ